MSDVSIAEAKTLPRHAPWTIMREALDEFEPDLKLEREQPPQQERPAWKR